ncbi:hypothetical protein SK128_001908 [Halocaridina rubra]|uniref:PH domain-containing protein n=1 Tax=Halocaridina rubra TaxID=373956 RepID=A0AAN9ADX2_HALRR
MTGVFRIKKARNEELRQKAGFERKLSDKFIQWVQMTPFSSWKKYYFVLEGKLLTYYQSENDYKGLQGAKGSLDLAELQDVEVKKQGKAKLRFPFSVSRQDKKTADLAAAETEEDREEWVKVILQTKQISRLSSSENILVSPNPSQIKEIKENTATVPAAGVTLSSINHPVESTSNESETEESQQKEPEMIQPKKVPRIGFGIPLDLGNVKLKKTEKSRKDESEKVNTISDMRDVNGTKVFGVNLMQTSVVSISSKKEEKDEKVDGLKGYNHDDKMEKHQNSHLSENLTTAKHTDRNEREKHKSKQIHENEDTNNGADIFGKIQPKIPLNKSSLQPNADVQIKIVSPDIMSSKTDGTKRSPSPNTDQCKDVQSVIEKCVEEFKEISLYTYLKESKSDNQSFHDSETEDVRYSDDDSDIQDDALGCINVNAETNANAGNNEDKDMADNKDIFTEEMQSDILESPFTSVRVQEKKNYTETGCEEDTIQKPKVQPKSPLNNSLLPPYADVEINRLSPDSKRSEMFGKKRAPSPNTSLSKDVQSVTEKSAEKCKEISLYEYLKESKSDNQSIHYSETGDVRYSDDDSDIQDDELGCINVIAESIGNEGNYEDKDTVDNKYIITKETQSDILEIPHMSVMVQEKSDVEINRLSPDSKRSDMFGKKRAPSPNTSLSKDVQSVTEKSAEKCKEISLYEYLKESKSDNQSIHYSETGDVRYSDDDSDIQDDELGCINVIAESIGNEGNYEDKDTVDNKYIITKETQSDILEIPHMSVMAQEKSDVEINRLSPDSKRSEMFVKKRAPSPNTSLSKDVQSVTEKSAEKCKEISLYEYLKESKSDNQSIHDSETGDVRYSDDDSDIQDDELGCINVIAESIGNEGNYEDKDTVDNKYIITKETQSDILEIPHMSVMVQEKSDVEINRLSPDSKRSDMFGKKRAPSPNTSLSKDVQSVTEKSAEKCKEISLYEYLKESKSDNQSIHYSETGDVRYSDDDSDIQDDELGCINVIAESIGNEGNYEDKDTVDNKYIITKETQSDILEIPHMSVMAQEKSDVEINRLSPDSKRSEMFVKKRAPSPNTSLSKDVQSVTEKSAEKCKEISLYEYLKESKSDNQSIHDSETGDVRYSDDDSDIQDDELGCINVIAESIGNEGNYEDKDTVDNKYIITKETQSDILEIPHMSVTVQEKSDEKKEHDVFDEEFLRMLEYIKEFEDEWKINK